MAPVGARIVPAGEDEVIEDGIVLDAYEIQERRFVKLKQRILDWGLVALPALSLQLILIPLTLICNHTLCPDGREQTTILKCPMLAEVPTGKDDYCRDGTKALRVNYCDPFSPNITTVVDPICLGVQLSAHVLVAFICYMIPAFVLAFNYIRIVQHK